MPSETSTLERWHFSAAILLPVVLALGVTAAATFGFVLWSTAGIDQRALERQANMIHEVMDARQDQLIHELGSVAIWDDSVINTRLMFNFNWVNTNLGAWPQEFFGHDQTVVLDGTNLPLYLMRDGISQDVEAGAGPSGPVQLLVDRLRALPHTPATPGTSHKPLALADYAVVDGIPSLIAAMTLVSDTGAIVQSPGTEPLIAAVQYLDDAAAAELAREYLFEQGRFSLSRTDDPDRAVYPIFSSAGRFIAFFEWNRDRPGLMLLRQTGPVLAAAFIMAAVLVFLLLRKLRHSSAALEAERREAEYQAAHDLLTGLPNRTSFDAELARALADQPRKAAGLALLMLDVDRFKQVNDTLGHQAGDELIRAVGQRIRSIVGPGVTIARLGGDEFVMLIVERDHGMTTALASRIIEAIGQPFDLNRFKAHVGASIGIVHAGAGNAEAQELMRKADIALYEAKAGGRNRAVVYEEHMNELLQLQHTIEAELREALQRDDQLSVVFQPLVDQQTRKVIGAECLARWHHPKYGQISPARFIPVAENTGLIEALGEFVLRRACELGATAPGRTIAVNISPTQLRNPRFSSQVFDILSQTGMRPVDLELEITESILLDNEHLSGQNLRAFRSAGIHIALDDFGTGYSSLSYLKLYPVDRIKIDRSFVSQLADGHVSVAITQAIVSLAHAMDLAVTAEGVETDGQATILGQLGCNTLQGFLFSGGVPADQITTMFADKANAFEPESPEVVSA
ncbi:MAG: EAL domain-containing protein [Alphaproteobacteria bacterium]|nr:EAL domain-containing protein [Alphaproteobacteria bacterium]MBU1560537.1 EAL domain-containing protein [Alphaproteobacteria bacterium]MBU2301363.1 EAL domain-containing protein [Alphaproteobacteria bacterium]MBU2366735.1 EAL domain-containing protein [Alphaproteobacteria bacterium]